MFHFSSPSSWTTQMPASAKLAFLCVVITGLLALTTGSAFAAENDKGVNKVGSLTVTDKGTSLEIKVSNSKTPTYTVYELFNPPRIVLDIAETAPGSEFAPQLPPEFDIILSTKQLTDVSPSLFRFEFTLPQSMPFEASQDGNNVILTINKGDSVGTEAMPTSSLEVTDIQVKTSPDQTSIKLLANGELTDYTYDVLDSKANTPARMYIDLNTVTGDTLLQEQMVGTSLSRIRVAKRGSGLRIVFDSSTKDLFPFTVQSIPNGLEVIIDEPQQVDQISALIKEKTTIESQLPEVHPLENRLSPQATEKQLQDAFNFSGYNKERITVDFYKIDLHNVFRLFREVSGINIVVDESVSGSLTLALDDVPWDFALDIILNLKNLAKEERFNTLVILPKDKSFNWAKQVENNISFEADIEVAEQEALIIRQQKNLPKEVIEAKQLIAQAKKAEKRENFELAISFYEQAFVKWADNGKLANRIASIYLVRLRQNAKAVFYAKKALTVDPDNTAAALNAAIGLANMQELQQAVEFFDQSISAEKPSAEALLSYAVFSEGKKEYDSALKLLSRYDKIYGQNLNSMIAVARVNDKLGNHAVATEKYQAILLAGFRIPPDLAKFIKGRIALKQTM